MSISARISFAAVTRFFTESLAALLSRSTVMVTGSVVNAFTVTSRPGMRSTNVFDWEVMAPT